MKKVLITGGGGYIGSHVAKLFLEKGISVVVLDNFSRGYRQPINILSKIGSIESEEIDLLDPEGIKRVFAKHDIGSVLHFAGLCSVHESVEKPEMYQKNNVEGTRNLLNAMLGADVQNIVFSSTSAVYGETEVLPVIEDQETNPMNPYGLSKRNAEKVIQEYGEKYGFRFVIFRYFNVCGAASDGMIGDSKKPSQHLMQNAVRGAMGIEQFSYTCSKVNTPDGTPIRDYIDVEDLAQAHYLGYGYLQNGGKSDIFNLGNGTGYSVQEIVSEVQRVFGMHIEKKQAEPRMGEHAAMYADASKARHILGFRNNKSLSDSIRSLQKWYAGHPKGYKE
ncbi:MAG: UDP-glucose 4-epimerase GalE [bacterium]|nr:UDP-glucose 4-epimerase GalE [bacterium]